MKTRMLRRRRWRRMRMTDEEENTFPQKTNLNTAMSMLSKRMLQSKT